jgi:hypothetical protein
LEQNLRSIASFVPFLEQVPAGHVTVVHLPPAQLPIPFILFAKASVVKIFAGIDKLRIATAPAIIHFIK